MIENFKFSSKIGNEPGRTIIDDHQRSLLDENTKRLFQFNNDLRRRRPIQIRVQKSCDEGHTRDDFENSSEFY